MARSKKLSWQDKAVAATLGSQFGAIINCALSRTIPAPYFLGKASLTSDGFLLCGFVDKEGGFRSGAFVGSKEDLDRNVRGLIKHLKLLAPEATAFEAAINSWVGTKVY